MYGDRDRVGGERVAAYFPTLEESERGSHDIARD